MATQIARGIGPVLQQSNQGIEPFLTLCRSYENMLVRLDPREGRRKQSVTYRDRLALWKFELLAGFSDVKEKSGLTGAQTWLLDRLRNPELPDVRKADNLMEDWSFLMQDASIRRYVKSIWPHLRRTFTHRSPGTFAAELHELDLANYQVKRSRARKTMRKLAQIHTLARDAQEWSKDPTWLAVAPILAYLAEGLPE